MWQKGKLVLAFLLVVLFSNGVRANFAEYLFDDSEKQQQYESMLKEFRCVTCPNQNIADSQAPIAIAMREEIFRQFNEGRTSEAISQYLLSHYGDYVSYRPLLKRQNALLWLGPGLMLILGFYLWVRQSAPMTVKA